MADDKQMVAIEEEEEKAAWLDNPVIAGGVGAGIAVLALQMVNYRRFKKQKMPTSIFLQQTRIYAQGIAVGALLFGAGFSIYQGMQKRKEKQRMKEAAEAGQG